MTNTQSIPRVAGLWSQALRRSTSGGSSWLPIIAKRSKSGPYGYTQAKALVFSRYGEPADVLKYDDLENPKSIDYC